MTWVKDVCDRGQSLWLRVVRSARAVDDFDEVNRVIDGVPGTSFKASRFDIATDLSRWEVGKPANFKLKTISGPRYFW